MALSRQVPPGLPRVLADPLLLRRVMVNLVRNACSALSESAPSCAAPGRIDICCGSTAEGVQLAIADNGPGLPASVLERLQAASWKSWVGGHGLDLVRRLVAQMAGELDIESLPGQGTTFRILLRSAGTHEP